MRRKNRVVGGKKRGRGDEINKKTFCQSSPPTHASFATVVAQDHRTVDHIGTLVSLGRQKITGETGPHYGAIVTAKTGNLHGKTGPS